MRRGPLLLHCLGLALLLTLPLLAGCSSVGYYWQSVSGHLALMQAARPVSDWLSDPATDAPLKARLELSQEIRRFAASELHLPDNASYQRYADLRRPAAVWNVSAAPELSLQLAEWCFPVAGCVNYKGFYDLNHAQAEAARLRAQGLEVSVYPVPAYSTLGWLNWAGGDPLLNTFIDGPDAELARLIFHELAHQVAYAANDTAFNESFATAVERIGLQRWLALEANAQARDRYALLQPRRQAFRALRVQLRQDLLAAYGESDSSLDADTDAQPVNKNRKARAGSGALASGIESPESAEVLQRRRQAKAEVQARFNERYGALKANWGGYAGYDPWVARLNNAALGAGATYERWVPAFDALFQAQGEDWPQFYTEVRRLAALPRTERRQALLALQGSAAHPGHATAGTPNE